jgi:uncharacterized YigZ family protein
MEENNLFLVPTAEIRRELKVVNSRFIATLSPAGNIESARTLINRVQKEFPDATHHVPAFIIGHGRSRLAHCSDAGEPSGSAGRPALAVLQGSGLGDVVTVITRYFGGTKLGVGGLVRAYGDAVRLVVRDVPRARKIQVVTTRLSFSYPFVDRVRLLVRQYSGELQDQVFEADVNFIARLPVEKFPDFENDMAILTSGNAMIEKLATGDALLPVDHQF